MACERHSTKIFMLSIGMMLGFNLKERTEILIAQDIQKSREDVEQSSEKNVMNMPLVDT